MGTFKYNLKFNLIMTRQFPGLDVLIEALREDIGLLDMAIDGLPLRQHEILYSTLLGMSPDERHKLLRICITHPPEDRSFLIETIGSGLVDKRIGLYNRTKFNTDLQAVIKVVDTLYHQQGVVAQPPTERRLRDLFVSSGREHRYADVSLLFLDIDHFKEVNDRYGHSVGDRALHAATAIALHSLRVEDHQRFYRYGGEEFAAILPYTSVEQAVVVAERIRHNVETTLANSLPSQGRQPARGITFSIGIANYRATIVNSVELVEQADLALYAAKDAGRNCVKIYNESMLTSTMHIRYLNKIAEE